MASATANNDGLIAMAASAPDEPVAAKFVTTAVRVSLGRDAVEAARCAG